MLDIVRTYPLICSKGDYTERLGVPVVGRTTTECNIYPQKCNSILDLLRFTKPVPIRIMTNNKKAIPHAKLAT